MLGREIGYSGSLPLTHPTPVTLLPRKPKGQKSQSTLMRRNSSSNDYRLRHHPIIRESGERFRLRRGFKSLTLSDESGTRSFQEFDRGHVGFRKKWFCTAIGVVYGDVCQQLTCQRRNIDPGIF